MTVLYTAEQIDKRVNEIASQLNSSYKELIIVGVLNGSFMFVSDLFKYITIPCQIDFIRVKSYEDNKSTGKITWLKDLELNIENKDVLIVDDIIDTGTTMNALTTELSKLNPNSIITASLLRRSTSKGKATYTGFEISSDAYVIGYGLDDNGYSRNCPFIYCK